METLNTTTLTPDKLPTPEKSLNGYKVAICDIDYTLVDFAPAHEAGIRAIEDEMGDGFAGLVSDFFNVTLVGHRLKTDHVWEHRERYEEILKNTKKLHDKFAGLHGHKVWSRETWIIMAAEELGVPLDAAKVTRLRDAYWVELTRSSQVYPDAREFLNEIRKKEIALVLMTGSDSILKIHPDLSLDYDPDFSEAYKKRRVEKLGFEARAIIIGDPIVKPDPRYFEKLFTEIGNFSDAQKEEMLVVGDSQRNDLDVPANFGYPTLLIERR